MALPNSLSELYTHVRKTLFSAGVETAERDARVIIRHHTELEWADIIARPDTRVSPVKLARIEFDIERRLAGEPVSRIYGERAFWGLDFKICPDTLDPRPDTETLVEVAVDRLADTPPQRILDLGTGSGCILIALLSEWEEAQGFGCDVALPALKTAQGNARYNDAEDRTHLFCGSWSESLDGEFDLIVSNPPYISNQVIPTLSEEVKNHDPILALDGGKDGLDAYRSLFMEIDCLLKKSGIALFEIGYDQEKQVVRLAEESGLRVKHVHHDLAGQPRVVEISCGDK